VNVYIATARVNTDAYHRTRQALEAAGHTITHDWTRDLPDQEPPPGGGLAALSADLDGIDTADVVGALWHPAVYGTLVEIGYALSGGKPVLLIGTWPRSVFWDHPKVHRCDFGEVIHFLAKLELDWEES
jgi:nucleoside 2-deoxyribosyltransferase